MQRLGSSDRVLNLALAGCGTVGGGVVELLRRHDCICVKKVLVKDVGKKRHVDLPEGCELVSDWKVLVDDPSIDVVVEVMGGVDLAKEVTFTAMKNKKHVVTANKALISKHLDELVKIQKSSSTFFMFEAAICGGIPIVNAIQRGLCVDNIQRIVGIMNGTTNYVLTEMHKDASRSYASVLKEAQDKGYAEADPAADVEGWDARSKLCILAKLAYGLTIDENSIYCNGISQVNSIDFNHAKVLSMSIKLLGVAEKRCTDGEISIYVSPCLVQATHPIAKVEGVTNIVEVLSTNLGATYYTGPGAGRFATANSIVADIMDLSSRLGGANSGDASHPQPYSPFPAEKVATSYQSDYETTFYIRFIVQDRVGVIHTVVGLMAKFGLSIYSILQTPITDPKCVPFSIITDKTKLSAVKSFCDTLTKGKSAEYGFLIEVPFFMPYLK